MHLELLAAFLAIKSFFNSILNTNVLIMLDNTAAVYIISRKATTHNDTFKDIVVQIGECYEVNDILLTACHIPGTENFTADRESRISQIMMQNGCFKS